MEEQPENQKRNDKHPGEIVVNQFIEHRRPELLGRSHANRFKQRIHGLVVRRNRPAGTALGGRHRQERKCRAPRGLGRDQLRYGHGEARIKVRGVHTSHVHIVSSIQNTKLADGFGVALNKLLVRTEPQDARIRFVIQYELHNIRYRPSVARENRFPEKLVGIDAELCDFTEHNLPAREGKRVARRNRAPFQVA